MITLCRLVPSAHRCYRAFVVGAPGPFTGALVQHLDLHDVIHIGHCAGGGEVARYLGRHGESRVAKVILVSAVTPSVLQTDANPAGVPLAAFEGLQAQLARARPLRPGQRGQRHGPLRSSRTGGARA